MPDWVGELLDGEGGRPGFLWKIGLWVLFTGLGAVWILRQCLKARSGERALKGKMPLSPDGIAWRSIRRLARLFGARRFESEMLRAEAEHAAVRKRQIEREAQEAAKFVLAPPMKWANVVAQVMIVGALSLVVSFIAIGVGSAVAGVEVSAAGWWPVVVVYVPIFIILRSVLLRKNIV
jgi:hypothetical protein